MKLPLDALFMSPPCVRFAARLWAGLRGALLALSLGTLAGFVVVAASALTARSAHAASASPSTACRPALAESTGAADAASAPATEKFSMIAAQCSLSTEAAPVPQAGQLDLYDRGAMLDISGAPAAPSVAGTPAAAPAPAAAASAAPAPQIMLPPTRDQHRVLAIVPALTQAAQANQLDPLLLHAVAHVESRHNVRAVSPAGARGVMQVMPATARRFGVADPERNLFDAGTNAQVSSVYLRALRNRFGDDLRLVLAAYNAGEGAVEKYGRTVPPYPETRAYVRDVLAVYRRLRSLFTVNESGAIQARARPVQPADSDEGGLQ